MKNKILATAIFIALFNFSTIAQINTWNSGDINTITTAVPFALINPDVATQGKGGFGVTSSSFYPEIGIFHNPALLATRKKYLTGSHTYIPWLRALVPDINLLRITSAWGFHKNHAVAVQYTRFSLGDITFTDNVGNVIGTFRPVEYKVGLSYGIVLGKHITAGVGFKYIHSDITGGIEVEGVETHAAESFAGDIGFNYNRDKQLDSTRAIRWSLGMAVQNIGNKVAYTDSTNTMWRKDFIPTNLKLGAMLTFKQGVGKNPGNYFAFDVGYELNKLLVPTPPIYQTDSTGTPVTDGNGNYVVAKGKDPNVSMMQGMVQSFGDAPGGFNEEMRELTHTFSTEVRHVIINRFYWALRGGYFNEHATKGNRKYITLGVGIGFYGVTFSYARFLPTEGSRHPLRKTNMFQIGYIYTIGDFKKPFSE